MNKWSSFVKKNSSVGRVALVILWITSLTNTWNWQKAEVDLPCHRPPYWNRIQRHLPTVFRYQSFSYHPHRLCILHRSFVSSPTACSQENTSSAFLLFYQIDKCVYAHVHIIQRWLWHYFLRLHLRFRPHHFNTLTKSQVRFKEVVTIFIRQVILTFLYSYLTSHWLFISFLSS
jgi:hypothetical protein